MDNHGSSEASSTFDAKPCAFTFVPSRTALLLVELRRDPVLPSALKEPLPADPCTTQVHIELARKLLNACRSAGLAVFHYRQTQGRGVKDGLIDGLLPDPGEVIVNKLDQGPFIFSDTDLMHKLKARGITHLLVHGLKTECCASIIIREATHRGLRCCAIVKTVAAGFKTFREASSPTSFVATVQPVLDALSPLATPLPLITAESPPSWDGKLDIPSLRTSYRAGVRPTDVVKALCAKIQEHENTNPGSWIHLSSKEDALAAAAELAEKFPDRDRLPPLFGIPFSVKDSIDVAGMPTTTACGPLAQTPTASAPVYEALIEQGALFMGKANLDQLATGMTGQRSPYGAPSSTFNSKYISGGSSSGSCVHVGADLVSFSLGTDTAGSGRVPAAFNGVVGFKPTPGTVSMVGVTPACQSLDCIAIIASTTRDARTVGLCLESFDPRDPYSKGPSFRKNARMLSSTGPGVQPFRFGIPPPEILNLCCTPYKRLFAEAVRHLQEMGGVLHSINWKPFENAGQLLYDGSFVHERLTSLPDYPGGPAAWLVEHKDGLHPVIFDVFSGVLKRGTSPADIFRDLQAQRRYTAQVHNEIFIQAAAGADEGVDMVIMPTAPTHWTVVEVRNDPIEKNSALGVFTHSANVLDLCAVCCPAGTFDAAEIGGKGTLPFGVMFVGPSGMDCEVLDLAARFEGMRSTKNPWK